VILWLAAQLSPALASWITARFAPIQAVPVRELGLRDADDRVIFAQARSAGAVVMTKDRDFLHLLFEQGPPPQVIWLRVGNSSNQALQAVLLRTLDQAIASLRYGEPWVEIRSPR
jgi:predicted nuclease of predicted toxin-antitoxin system